MFPVCLFWLQGGPNPMTHWKPIPWCNRTDALLPKASWDRGPALAPPKKDHVRKDKARKDKKRTYPSQRKHQVNEKSPTRVFLFPQIKGSTPPSPPPSRQKTSTRNWGPQSLISFQLIISAVKYYKETKFYIEV